MTPEPAATVQTESTAYPIYVEPGCLSELGELLRDQRVGGRAVVVSDEAVANAHADAARASLERAGFAVELITIGQGEPAKSLDTASSLYDRLVELAVERRDAIVALGGGVVGDVAGFVAATYLRGIPLVHVPTSLLAMADAAIGGKTGVNHPRGKNLIGAFYQPILVLEDPLVLATMPDRAYREGFAELIKHGMIADLDLLEALESKAQPLLDRDPAALTGVLASSARVKAAIVSDDERESDKRMWLNYGHTIGHAIEAASGYGAMLHGEAVAIGMMAAAKLAQGLDLLGEDEVARHAAVLQLYSLPLAAEGVPLARIREAMALDKKRADGKQQWVLLEGLANPIVRSDVEDEVVTDALAKVGIA